MVCVLVRAWCGELQISSIIQFGGLSVLVFSPSTIPGLLLLLLRLLLHRCLLELLARPPSTASAQLARLPARTRLAAARAA